MKQKRLTQRRIWSTIPSIFRWNFDRNVKKLNKPWAVRGGNASCWIVVLKAIERWVSAAKSMSMLMANWRRGAQLNVELACERKLNCCWSWICDIDCDTDSDSDRGRDRDWDWDTHICRLQLNTGSVDGVVCGSSCVYVSFKECWM